MEYVYLVESNLVVGCEKLHSLKVVCKTYDEAKSLFEQEKSIYVEDYVKKLGWLQTCGNQNSFECFEEGYYQHNNATVSIEKLELVG